MKKKTILFCAGLALSLTILNSGTALADSEGNGDKTYDTTTCKLTDGFGNVRTGSWCDVLAINGPCARESDCH